MLGHAAFWVSLLLLVAAVPLALIALGRARRRPDGSRRVWVVVIASALLWVAFDLSFAAVWGALFARRWPELSPMFAIAMLLLQPVGIALSLWVASRRDGPA